MTTTKEALEPCPLAHPIVNGVRFTNFSNNVKAHIWCYDCGLEFEGRVNEPRDKVAERWNSRVSAPVVDIQELQRKADELPAACEHGNLDPRDIDRLIEGIAAAPAATVAPQQSDNTAIGLQRRLYEECVTANWDPERKNTFAEEIAHLHEELSEAFCAWRRYKDCEVREVNGKLEGVPVEFADALIGMFYNAELYGFDLLAAVERKHQFNLNRNYVAEGRQLHAAAPASPAALRDEAENGDQR